MFGGMSLTELTDILKKTWPNCFANRFMFPSDPSKLIQGTRKAMISELLLCTSRATSAAIPATPPVQRDLPSGAEILQVEMDLRTSRMGSGPDCACNSAPLFGI